MTGGRKGNVSKLNVKELETADYDILENIKTAFYRLWNLKLVVILAAFVGFLASLVYISVVGVHTTYYSVASIYSAVYGSYEESTYGVKVMNTYANLLNTSRVCGRAAENLRDCDYTEKELQNMVNSGRVYLRGYSSDSKKYGYSLTMVATSSQSEHVVEIANAMAQAFADEINDLLGSSTLQVLNPAKSISTMQSINIKLYIVLFTAAAMLLAIMIIFVKEFFSSRVFCIGQCEQDEDYILGLIPYNK